MVCSDGAGDGGTASQDSVDGCGGRAVFEDDTEFGEAFVEIKEGGKEGFFGC